MLLSSITWTASIDKHLFALPLHPWLERTLGKINPLPSSQQPELHNLPSTV